MSESRRRSKVIYVDQRHRNRSYDRNGALERIVGDCPAIQELRKTIVKVAMHDCHVLVLGEHGTGKELVALALHQNSMRANGPFIAVNCGAVAETMAESEFLGHERGAFTGANRRHLGFFEQANGGVIFLDEIADLPLALQVKLLRVIQENEVVRVGSDTANTPIPIDIRVVAATNKNLDEEVKSGRFREDLYWRLVEWEFYLPPLRERGHDIIKLFRLFLRKVSKSKRLSREIEDILLRYHWPGNIRQLQKVVEHICIVCSGRRINAEHLNLKEWNPTVAHTNESREEQILKLIDQQGTVSPAEISTLDGMNENVASKALRKMEKNGILIRIGKGRGTRYARADRAVDTGD